MARKLSPIIRKNKDGTIAPCNAIQLGIPTKTIEAAGMMIGDYIEYVPVPLSRAIMVKWVEPPPLDPFYKPCKRTKKRRQAKKAREYDRLKHAKYYAAKKEAKANVSND